VKERHGGRDVWQTRKGAVDAHEDVRAVIPNSMGTRSYILRGKGNAAGLCSAPHRCGPPVLPYRGAQALHGRRSRLADPRHRVPPREEWIDEIPDAYKDIDQVTADAADLVEVEHVLRQILNVKG
jgi:tRNA-splicing ligase RtcB